MEFAVIIKKWHRKIYMRINDQKYSTEKYS